MPVSELPSGAWLWLAGSSQAQLLARTCAEARWPAQSKLKQLDNHRLDLDTARRMHNRADLVSGPAWLPACQLSLLC